MAILTASDAADMLAPIFAGRQGEALAVLHLDAARGLIALDERAAAGDEIALPIREILKAALDRGTAGLVIAHNHPSGDPRPSRADILATRKLAETADALGIRLHDHLIFAAGLCSSFRELGLL